MSWAVLNNAWAVAGVVSACVTGFLGVQYWASRLRVKRVLRGVLALGTNETSGAKKSEDAVLAYMKRLTGRLHYKHTKLLCPTWLQTSAWFSDVAAAAGCENTISLLAYCEARLRLALLIGLAGCVLGCVFSGELMLLLGIAGAGVGWRLPTSSVKRRQRERAESLEAHLPEMLEVLALGMRSGLAFDVALKLYCSHFSVELARELALAQSMWASGLARREDALRTLASSYDSALFMRVVEVWIRSLRLGSSMTASLEAESSQARAQYKTKREERIAKAPVKMMVPTGVLILPAMLLLVLGPILLELMNGGFDAR